MAHRGDKTKKAQVIIGIFVVCFIWAASMFLEYNEIIILYDEKYNSGNPVITNITTIILILYTAFAIIVWKGDEEEWMTTHSNAS